MFQTDALIGQTTSFAILLLILAPFIGSFLAVLVDRLPRGEDIVVARSRCRSCDTVLTWRDLVPVLSFVVTRGRCRHCGAAVPLWLPAMELAALAAAGLVIAAQDGTWGAAEFGLQMLTLWLLLALLAADFLWMRLPDVLTGMLFVVAMLAAPDFVTAFWGAVLGVLSFAALRWGYKRVRGREGLGFGDVKLMAGLGALSGPLDLPLLVLVAALLALAGAMVQRLFGKEVGRATALPFGAALSLAGGLLWVAREVAVTPLI